MRAVLLTALVLSSGLAGCLGDNAPPSDPGGPPPASNTSAVPDRPRLALTGCEGGFQDPCFEPSAAWSGDGDLLVTEVDGRNASRSSDAGHTFEAADPPSMPEGVDARIDSLFQTGPEGRVWWSALAGDADPTGRPVEVARSDDGGRTWAVHHVLTMSLDGEPTGATEASDRQWLAFGLEGTAYLVCNCPVGTTQMRTSTDGGETWSQPSPIPTLERPGPVGKPAVTSEGTIVAPYLTGPLTQPVGVAVSVSDDGGESWDVHEVWTAPDDGGVLCCGSPHAAATGEGTVFVGWHADDGRALVASSPDGRVWGPPGTWSTGGADGIYPHVWLEPLNETAVFATWFEGADAGNASVEAAWGTAEGVLGRETLGQGQARTDHPYAVLGPEGRLAVPFVNGDGDVVVRVLQTPAGTAS